MALYKMFNSGVTSVDGAVSIDMPVNGTIERIWYDWRFTGPAGGISSQRCELSFASSSGFAANDTKQSFLTISSGESTAANGQYGRSGFIDNLDIKYSEADRIFMHNLVTTAHAASALTVYLFCSDKSEPARRRL